MVSGTGDMPPGDDLAMLRVAVGDENTGSIPHAALLHAFATRDENAVAELLAIAARSSAG